MSGKNQMKTSRIWVSIAVVFSAGILIWNFMINISDHMNRLIIALITTLLTVALIEIVRRINKVRWRELGQQSIRNNTLSFFLGFILFTIPACIGFIICVKVGWTEIKIHTDWNILLFQIAILFITVFLMEALPEELFFRGIIYSYLNAIFPHWATVILQALLFSIFAYFIGAMYSVEQIQFIPGFALILGYFRAVSGNVWTTIGFHLALMTAFQMLNFFDVHGMMMLKFFAFILFPSTIGAIILGFIFPNHKWSKKSPIST